MLSRSFVNLVSPSSRLLIQPFGVRFSSRKRYLRVRRPNIASSRDKWQKINDSNRQRRMGKSRSKDVELPPYKFGSYPSLKLPDEKTRQGIARVVAKIDSFSQLKLLPEIRDALIKEIKDNTVLRTQNYVDSHKKVKTAGEINGLVLRPTPIQTAAIKVLTAKRSPDDFIKVYTLAAETGSGKTWAYLAPLLQFLKEQDLIKHPQDDFVTLSGEEVIKDEGKDGKSDEEEGLAEEPVEAPRHRKAGIRSIILVPTHELVDQVYTTVSHTESTLGTHAFRWDTDSNFKVFMNAFRKGIDVLVTTPPKLLSLTRYDSVKHPRALLGSVNYCVVDEADTLMDESFIKDTFGVLRNMGNLQTLVFASATIPAQFSRTINKLFPKVTSISTPALHKLPRSIEFRVINASVSPYKESKMKALAQTLYAIHCDGSERGYEKRVLVFVNNKEDCSKVAIRLHDKYGDDVTFISGDDTAEERKLKVQSFIDPPKKLEDPKRPVLKVLVCTDLLSRGLNFSGIRNVVLLDVPHNSADLVHRAGRTGRMNQSGRVFLIINNKDKSHVKGLPKVLRNNRRLG